MAMEFYVSIETYYRMHLECSDARGCLAGRSFYIVQFYVPIET